MSRPPSHLSTAAKRLWADVTGRYVLEPRHEALLEQALSALDRAEAARAEIGAGPLMVESRLGEQKPHVLLAVERDARAQFSTLMKALNLDIEPPPSARGRR